MGSIVLGLHLEVGWGCLHTGHTAGALSAISTWPQLRQNHMTFSPFLKTSPFFRLSSSFKYLSSWVFSILPRPRTGRPAPGSPPPRGLRHLGVHLGPFLVLACSGSHQVLLSAADAVQGLEPQLGVLLLIQSGFLEDGAICS